MAQVLKDDLRNKIMHSAADEFLEKGFQDASMRRIAAKSGMTVGNLYRYFKSKEDINRSIVGGTLGLLDDMVSELTGGALSLRNDSYENLEMDMESFRSMLDQLSARLVEIYCNARIPFRILMLRSELNSRLTEWFANLIEKIIRKKYDALSPEQNLKALSRIYAVSIFSGAREIFRTDEQSPEALTQMLSIFFKSFTFMLEQDMEGYAK